MLAIFTFIILFIALLFLFYLLNKQGIELSKLFEEISKTLKSELGKIDGEGINTTAH